MSDDDENLVCFTKIHEESKSNNATSVEDRVMNCMSNEDCKCMYCNYKNNAADMVVEFLSRDIMTFEKNNGARFCTYDLKDIFFKAIMEIKKMEKEGDDSE